VLPGPGRRGENAGGDIGVGPEDGRDLVTKGDTCRSRQGGNVDDQIGLVSPHHPETVSEYQPPLGICVEHLDGRTGDGAQHVTGACGVATDRVVGDRDDGGDANRKAEPGDSDGRNGHDCGT
jgi:hypothetical protein